MSNEITYNGYAFNDQSHVKISAEMVEDDAGRTIVYHRYRIRVDSIIVASSGDSFVGQHFRRIRQLLSKDGGTLLINHPGFGPALNINAGSYGYGGVSDVCFGPKPKIIAWDPVGATNAVEVTWECEFCLPTCEGLGDVRFTGLAALNYGISYKIDNMGYTTRTVAGYLEIAMTRIGRSIPDTADAYREVIVVPKIVNFERETSWQISLDKRRADFTITDTEINSPNAYPPGVIKIRANHRVGWSRQQLANLPNTINATITLAPDQPRGWAWVIFRNIVNDRLDAARSVGRNIFLQSIEVDEELYEHSISFSISYRILIKDGNALRNLLDASGLFSAPPGDWPAWQASLANTQTTRGSSNLAHSASEDQIVDLCTNTLLPSVPIPHVVNTPPPTSLGRFCNPKPPPGESYIRFEGVFTTLEDSPSIQQVTIGEDDLKDTDFDPNDPTSENGETDASKNITRFIESAAPGLEFEWSGYAERVGYDIPRPGKLTIGGVTLRRKGRGVFRKKWLGKYFCQNVYGAAWVQRYVVDTRPQIVSTDDANPLTPAPGDT